MAVGGGGGVLVVFCGCCWLVVMVVDVVVMAVRGCSWKLEQLFGDSIISNITNSNSTNDGVMMYIML